MIPIEALNQIFFYDVKTGELQIIEPREPDRIDAQSRITVHYNILQSFCDTLGNFHLIYSEIFWQEFKKNLLFSNALRGKRIFLNYVYTTLDAGQDYKEDAIDRLERDDYSIFYSMAGSIIGIDYDEATLFLLKKTESGDYTFAGVFFDSTNYTLRASSNRGLFSTNSVALSSEGLIAYPNENHWVSIKNPFANLEAMRKQTIKELLNQYIKKHFH